MATTKKATIDKPILRFNKGVGYYLDFGEKNLPRFLKKEEVADAKKLLMKKR